MKCKLFNQFCLYFLSSKKYIANVYMFQNHLVARYETEIVASREDASSSQAVDVPQIYIDEVGEVKKKLVYGLGSMGSLCLWSHVSSNSINIPSTSQSVQDS